MKEINIGRKIVAKRHEKSITQDDLAAHIGVSKAAVSKWETGQSYPDIMLIPQLATFFNISIDELMDYSPQLETQDIRKLYQRMATAFATQPFDQVMQECQEVIKKYYSCFPLLLQMTQLLINHHMLTPSREQQEEILHQTIDLCNRIIEHSEDIHFAKDATGFKALCLLLLNQPVQVLDILGETTRVDMSEKVLIAQAHQLLGDVEKAKEVTQIEMYLNLMSLFSAELSYLNLCAADFQEAEAIFEHLHQLSQTYEMETLSPNNVVLLYATGARMYCLAGEKQKATEMLTRYVDICTKHFFPIKLSGGSYFNQIDAWLEESAGTEAPRSEKVIKESMLHDVLMNPIYADLADEPDYITAVDRLRRFVEED